VSLSALLPRRQYLRVAGRALREGRVGWTVRQSVKSLALPLARRFDRPLSGPIIANLAITYRCNNVCYQCDLPRPWYYRRRGDAELVSGHELPCTVPDRIGMGSDGPVVQVAPQVCGERPDRRIALGGLLLERLEHDVVEVAPQRARALRRSPVNRAHGS